MALGGGVRTTCLSSFGKKRQSMDGRPTYNLCQKVGDPLKEEIKKLGKSRGKCDDFSLENLQLFPETLMKTLLPGSPVV